MGYYHQRVSRDSRLLDEKAAEQILQIDNLPKSKPAYDDLKYVIGKNSLVVIEGERWKRLRKMFNPAFAPSHIETFIPVILDESLLFIDILNKVADTGEIVKMNDLTTVSFR
jgi:cytochrome P450